MLKPKLPSVHVLDDLRFGLVLGQIKGKDRFLPGRLQPFEIEFGQFQNFGQVDGETILIDEVLTPDSSRFWPQEEYEPGRGQRSFDKQFVRDWLMGQPWDRNSLPRRFPTMWSTRRGPSTSRPAKS